MEGAQEMCLSSIKWSLVHPPKEAGLHPGHNGVLQVSYGQMRDLSDLHLKLHLAAARRKDLEGRRGGGQAGCREFLCEAAWLSCNMQQPHFSRAWQTLACAIMWRCHFAGSVTLQSTQELRIMPLHGVLVKNK